MSYTLFSYTNANGSETEWWQGLLLLLAVALIIGLCLLGYRYKLMYQSKQVSKVVIVSKEEYDEYVSSLYKNKQGGKDHA